jgi:5-methylcytosine-specific restriction endonuclease McrA
MSSRNAQGLMLSRDAMGKCESCGSILRPGHFDYDHDKPDAFGGSNALANCRVLCSGCHGTKTSQVDIPAIAKSNRIRARQAGIKKPSKFACSGLIGNG